MTSITFKSFLVSFVFMCITFTHPVSAQWTTQGNNIFNNNLSGKVGIGTTNPTGKLHVNLPNLTSRDEDSQQVIFGSDRSGLRFGYSSLSNIGTVNILKPGVSWGHLILQDDLGVNGGNVGVGGDPGSAKLYVHGNLGIGTTQPLQKLEVIGGVKINSGTRPACTSASRGTMWFTMGIGSSGPTAKDSFVVCAQDASGVSSWRTIY